MPRTLARRSLTIKNKPRRGANASINEKDKMNTKLLSKCKSLKSLYMKVQSVQNNLLGSLENPGQDDAWRLLGNDQNITSLRSKMGELQTMAISGFAASFLNVDLTELRRDYTGRMDDFWSELQAWETTWGARLYELDKEQQRMYNMYRAGQTSSKRAKTQKVAK